MRKREIIISICLIFTITFVSFFPSLKNGITNWDDDAYLVENPMIRNLSWKNIKAILSNSFLGHYHPLTLLSYSIEFKFFKSNPFPYHTTNFILHLCNGLLVFWLMVMLTGGLLTSFAVALLFGIHPLHVESVAWISSRKDVLYAFFFLGSMISYLYYRKTQGMKYYYLSLFLFLFSLLSKVMAVTLPVVLFLCDYFLNRKLDRKNFIEKIPFLIIAFVFGMIAIFSPLASPRAPAALIHKTSFFDYFLIISNMFITCLSKLIIPIKLSCLYPFLKEIGRPWPYVFLYWSAIAGFLMVGMILRKSTKKIILGGLFFFITILPVLPIKIFADRFTYIPSIGIFYIAGAGLSWLYQSKIGHLRMVKAFLLIIFFGCIGTFSFLTWERVQVWKDSITLWDDALKNYSKNPIAYNNRGNAYADKGLYDQAISDLNKAIEIDPRFPLAFNNRGNAYVGKGLYDQGISDFNKAIEIDPRFAKAYNNRGNAYVGKGLYDQAISDLNKAIEINPRFALAYNNRGNAYVGKGLYDQALSDFNKAIEINSRFAQAYNNRGNAYADKGLYDEALSNFNKAIEINPRFAQAYNNRGNAYTEKGLYDQALSDFNKAIEVEPRFTQAYNNRGNAYVGKGLYDPAFSDFNKAIEINPRFAQAYYNRGNAYVSKGLHDLALSDFNKAIGIDPRFAQAYSNRGNAYVSKGLYDQALSDFNKAIEINPRFAQAYSNRGNAYVSKGLYDEALSDFNKAIRIDPGYAQAYNNRGNAYVNKGLYDLALSDLSKAIRIDPGYAQAYNNRGNAYVSKGLYDQALSDLSKAIGIDPGYAQAYYNRGNAHFKKGLYDEALSDLNKAIEINPRFAGAYFSKALTLEKMGRTQDAIEAYRGFIQNVSPQYAPIIEYARKKIMELSK